MEACTLYQLRQIIEGRVDLYYLGRSLPKHFAENLVASMPRRVQALIEAKGDYTTY